MSNWKDNIPSSAWHNLFLLAGLGLAFFLMLAGLGVGIWAANQ